MTDSDSNGSNGRDNAGRFVTGNAFGLGNGNPRIKRLAELQATVREAGTPAKLRQILDVLHSSALTGDVGAARLWLERVAGKPREASGDALPVAIDCASLESCRESAARVVESAAVGDIDSDHAAKLLTMISVVVGAHDVERLEERLAAIEQQTPTNPNRGLHRAS